MQQFLILNFTVFNTLTFA